jgi:hypothetical protein
MPVILGLVARKRMGSGNPAIWKADWKVTTKLNIWVGQRYNIPGPQSRNVRRTNNSFIDRRQRIVIPRWRTFIGIKKEDMVIMY